MAPQFQGTPTGTVTFYNGSTGFKTSLATWMENINQEREAFEQCRVESARLSRATAAAAKPAELARLVPEISEQFPESQLAEAPGGIKPHAHPGDDWADVPRENLYPDCQTRAALSAASTRASRNGTLRRRTPVASWIAFATAAISGLHAVSPPPYGGRSGRFGFGSPFTSTTSILAGRVGMPKARMRDPIHARDLFRIELDLLMKRPAQRMQHRAFDGVAQRLRVDHEPAVVRAYQPLGPDVAGLAVHLDLGDLAPQWSVRGMRTRNRAPSGCPRMQPVLRRGRGSHP